MSESANNKAKPAKSSLWRRFLLLFMGLLLLGNLFIIFSLRDTLQNYDKKLHNIQNNANLISDRVYDLDARFTADELNLSKARGDLNKTMEMLGGTQQDVDDAGQNLAAIMRYFNQLAEALNYEERLEFQEPEVAPQEALHESVSAPAPAAVADPQGSMEWIDPTGKKHTVWFRDGKIEEAVE